MKRNLQLLANADQQEYQTTPNVKAASIIFSLTSARLIFQDGFESGNLNKWEYQACPGGVTISTKQARTGSHSAKFTVSDDDTDEKCSKVPTDNPRAQLVSPGLFKNGDEYYIGFSVFFPTNFPEPTDWFQLLELYGPPFGGSPTMGVDICDGNRLCFNRDQTHDYDSIWQSSPIVKGRWRDIVLHVKFSTNPSQGFVEIWDGGVQQRMSNGKNRVYYTTLHPGINWNGTPNSVFLNQYRSHDERLGTVTLYHDSVKVGTSLDEVRPAA